MGNTILKWTANAIFSLLGAIIVWAVKWMLRFLWWTVRQAIGHPRSSIAFGLLGAGVGLLGWQFVVITLGTVFVATSVWKAAHRASFERFLGQFARSWWRRWWHYARLWTHVMVRCGLVVEVDHERHAPMLRKVSTTPYWDRVQLRMQVGQDVRDFENAAERVRHAFGAERVAVGEIEPRSIGLDFMRRDPFRTVPVPAPAMPARTADINWQAVPIGITEHLQPFCIPITRPISAAGTMGSGKAGLEWGILRGVAPAVADGTVRPVFIDPKMKELRQGRALLHDPADYACTEDEVLELLRRLVDEMVAANEATGEAGERDHVPSPTRPLVLIFIDELAPLLAYWSRSKRDKIGEKLGLLLTQGRAAGYVVIGLIQEPTKDIFQIRDLFTGLRLCLRVPTEAHTDAALAEHAVDRGAQPHLIPSSLPGVVFSLNEGDHTAVRSRLGNNTDTDVAELCQYVTQLREQARFEARRNDSGSAAEAA